MAYEIVYWPGFTGRAEPAILLLEDVGEPDTVDTDVLLAVSQDFLSGAMALNCGRRGIHPQVLAGQIKLTAVVK